jgi:kinesin family protein 1
LEIETGSKITFGELHTFRFNHPEQARRQRSSRQRKCLFYPRSGLEDYSASCHDVLSTSIGTASTISNLSNVTESPVKGCMSPVKIRTIEDVYDSMARRNLQEIEERDINAKTSDGKLNESLTSGNMDETFVVSPAQIEYDLMGKKVQETLLRRVLNRWCRYKARSLILAIMENQAMLKEANVMSKELGHFLEFQFAILDSDTAAYANLKSFWDAADDAEDELRSIKSPTVVVQVVDEFHTSFWTLKRLSKFIHGVRRIYNMDPVDDDIKSVTTSDDDIHSPCRFSRIGNAVVPLNLSDKKKELVVPIFSRAEARVCGELALCLTLIHHENGEDVVEVAIESIKPGPYFANFTQVHCQFHQAALDSTLILGSKMDRTFCTDLASKWTDTIMFDYRQTVKIPRKQNDRPDSFKIFVFGAYGEQAEQERRLSNLSDCTAHLSLKPSVPTSLPVQKIMPTSNYDINSWIEVCELAPTGNYMPVPVISDSTFNVLNQDDPGVFILRQGVQRRVVLTLMHDAGPAFPWRRVIDVQISTIRFCTKNDKGVLMETVDNNSHDLSLRLLPSQRMVQKTREGKTLLWVESAWDSSLHESAFLNRVTESNSRVRICLTWYLEVDGFKEPMRLHSDINVQIHPMDTKLTSMQPSSSLNWWWFGSSRTSREIGKVSALFNVTVRSESNSSDSTSYVRGEENLGSWRPKGIELLLETSAMKVWEEFVLDTWSCRKQLNSIFVEDEQSHNTAKGVENNVQQSRLLQRCVGLWKRLLVPRVPSTAALTVKPMDKQSLVAAVEPVQKS